MNTNQRYDKTMLHRANNKLAELKEDMQKYLMSHGDAYKKFDDSAVGKM